MREKDMIHIIAVNGSPRKNGNTAMMLEKALEGAASQGAATELIHLYDLNFKGCTSCFACKLKDGKSYGRCAVRDDLSPVLDRIHDADALILGSPIYFGMVTGEMRSCMERLLFQYLAYTNPPLHSFRANDQNGFHLYDECFRAADERIRVFPAFRGKCTYP
jgi:multimeric flavodoxin WrbA